MVSSRASVTGSASSIEHEIQRLSDMPEVQAAFEWFLTEESQFTKWQMELAKIPAPPFGEESRAKWLEATFVSLGLKNVCRDNVGNVLGTHPGAHDRAVSISAHLDTVFPAGTPLNIKQQGPRLYGPGISDNAAGVAALLAIAAACGKFGLTQAAQLLFIGNVGEEGEGDLRGMRHVFFESEWKDSISASLVLDGAGADTIVAEALGSRRFEIVIRGPGGHSWSDFGAPNPIVAISHAIHLFSLTHVPSSPKTTFNVGVLEGGTSVNSIPESASMRVDMRSTSPLEIERLELELRKAVDIAVRQEEIRSGRDSASHRFAGLKAQIRTIGNRPGGELNPNAKILRIAQAVDAHLSNRAEVQRASTDANIPISIGREAIAIGAGGSGGGAHTAQEWFDVTARDLGLKRILLIVLALAGVDAAAAG